MSSEQQEPRESLNPYQANRLRITCHYIDKLLADVEGVLHTSTPRQPSRAIPPISCRRSAELLKITSRESERSLREYSQGKESCRSRRLFQRPAQFT